MSAIDGLRSSLAKLVNTPSSTGYGYVPPDEIVARSLRLHPEMSVDEYTGTPNDPFEQAQSIYAGPGWHQFFGALQKEEEDAKNAGMNFRVNWRGFGNR